MPNFKPPNIWIDEEEKGIQSRRKKKDLYSTIRNETKANDLSMGTSLVGYVDVSWNRLNKLFGYPTFRGSDDNKIDAKWVVVFGPQREVFTIYNYKDGISYLGPDRGTPVEEITDWHIGGKSSKIGLATELNKFFSSLGLRFRSGWRR